MAWIYEVAIIIILEKYISSLGQRNYINGYYFM